MPTPVWKRSETWVIGVALLTLITTVVLAYTDWRSFDAARVELDHTEEILRLAQRLFSSVQDLETGQRGYVLMGKLSYLAPYESAKAAIGSELTELDQRTAGDAPQHAQVERIAQLIQQKMAELQETVDLRKTQGFEAALAEVATDRGKRFMDLIRVEIGQFENDGRTRVQGLDQTQDRYRLGAVWVSLGGSGLLFVLLVVAAVLVRRRSDARELALAAAASGKREVERVRDLLETTLRSIGDAVITTDAAGNVTFLNTVARDLTGYREGSLGRPLADVFRIVNESTREPVESPIDKVRRTGMVAGLANHTLLLAHDGREIPIDDSGAPIRSSNQGIVGFVLVFRDISERKATESALRESENRFRTMANAAPVLLWVADAGGNVTFVNRQWTEFTGRPAEEALGSRWSRNVHPEDVPRIVEARRSALERRALHTFECRLLSADGRYRSVVCTETPRAAPDGLPAGYVGAWFDITDLKEAQRSLEISEERFRMLVAGTTSLIWRTDAGGAFSFELPGWEAFTGQSIEQYRGFGGIEAIHPEDRGMVLTAWEKALSRGETFTVEFRLWHQAPEEYRYVISRGVPLHGRDGKIVEWFGAVTDVTDQRRLEEKLREAAKLESLGILAGGIAHDFNNLLVGILGNAGMLQSLVTDREQQKMAQEILSAGERAAILTQQMLAYSGRGRFVVEPVDLSLETAQIVPLVQSSVPKHVDVVLNLAERLPSVEVDRAQFQQLVMNLVINGAEAIHGASGKVMVSTYKRTLDSSDIVTEFADDRIEPGVYVVLEVRDTGHGMDSETQAKIFDPFFTTKFTGRGLGLAAVLGIVKGHRGAIKVSSAPGLGSTFRLFLPASGAPVRATMQPEPSTEERGTATVLVADDEEVVRRVTQAALARHGFRVLPASNGQEAIDLLLANRSDVDAIVLDLSMPAMNGDEALPRLLEIRPDVRILALSGYAQDEAERRFGGMVHGFLHKPYSVQELLAALRAALGEPSHSARTV
ncbi:MAG: PAS domain S-box protein [Acidobacteriia bacterium]|nr:PAS domain S-box protein [Terriglobia bacterium]